MKRKTQIHFFLILLLLVTSCKQTPQNIVDETPIEVISLQITPALSHWMPKAANCAERLPGLGLYTQELPSAQMAINQADLEIRLGDRSENDPYVALMGIEEISIIAGAEVPISSLSIESLQSIYAGRINNWGSVPEIIESGVEVNQPILTFSYPVGFELQRLFRESYLDSNPIESSPRSYSTTEFGLSLIQDHPYAIAYLLKSQIPENIKTLAITGYDTLAAQHYVLAITPEEPQGLLREFLLCLQDQP